MSGWMKHIRTEQFSEDYQLLVRVIGLELTVKLAEELKSIHLYLKSPQRLFQAAKEEYVLEQLHQAGPGNPFNYRRMALETGLSERHIYDLVNESREKAKQGNLF